MTCVAYFAVFYPRYFRAHLGGDKLKTTLEVVSLLSAGCVVAMMVLTLCVGSFSYLVYRQFGSKQDFDRHFAVVLHLRNLEPVAAIAITLFFLRPGSRHNSLWLGVFRHPAWGALVLALFASMRIYYMVFGWKALRRAHPGVQRGELAFLVGFVPVELAGALVFTLVALVLGIIMVSNLD
jgi:hypothetical protein